MKDTTQNIIAFFKQYGDSGWITVKVFLNDGMKGFSIEFEDCLFFYYLGNYKYVGIDNTKYYSLPLIKSHEVPLHKNKIIDLIKNSTYKSDIPNYYIDFMLKKVAEYESSDNSESIIGKMKKGHEVLIEGAIKLSKRKLLLFFVLLSIYLISVVITVSYNVAPVFFKIFKEPMFVGIILTINGLLSRILSGIWLFFEGKRNLKINLFNLLLGLCFDILGVLLYYCYQIYQNKEKN